MELRIIEATYDQPCTSHAIAHGGPTSGVGINTRYSQSALVGHKLYVTGSICSYRKRGTPYSTVAILDIPRKHWNWVHCEGPGNNDGTAWLQEEMIFVAAVGDKSEGKLALHAFDVVLEEWLRLGSEGPSPEERRCFSGHLVEELGSFLLFGGQARRTGQPLNDVWMYSTEQHHWMAPLVKGSPPAPRWQHGSCMYNGIFYCYGGWRIGGRHNDGLYLLHMQGKHGTMMSWSKPQISGVPLGKLSSFAIVPVRGMLLFCGGRSDGGDHLVTRLDPVSGIFSALKLNIIDNAWAGFGVTAHCTENGDAVLLYGGTHVISSYARLSSRE